MSHRVKCLHFLQTSQCVYSRRAEGRHEQLWKAVSAGRGVNSGRLNLKAHSKLSQVMLRDSNKTASDKAGAIQPCNYICDGGLFLHLNSLLGS